MKVAFLTTDSREHFKDYGNPQPYFGTAPEALLEGFKSMPEDIEVHVISCLQRKPISSPAKLADNIYYHALQVPNIGWLKTGYQGCIRTVRSLLHTINPDIVHGQGSERECAICAALSGFPNVLTIHGVMRSIYKVTNQKPLGYYWFAQHLERIALSATDGLICISPYVRQLLSREVCRSWVIPNGLREIFFAPFTLSERAPGAARLLNVGVIGPRKRQLELLTLLEDLRGQCEFAINFVGKAPPGDPYTKSFLAALDKMNSKYGGFTHIEAAGNRNILELYDSSDAMIHFASEESYGLTFAEALARNLPLFASDVGAIRQIAAGIKSVEIFAPDDFITLGASIKQWVVQERHYLPRKTTPDALIQSRNHPRVIAAQHLQAYQETLQTCTSKAGENRICRMAAIALL
jgi:glycosyltransferase involved in cell wall biosynthesis